MEAVVVGVGFALAVALGGVGIAGGVPPEDRRLALGAVTALAVFVLLTGNAAALFGFRLWVAGFIAAGLALAGAWRLVVSRPHGVRGPAQPLAGLLAVTALVLAAPALVLPVPLDTDAQGFGHLALAMRDGGTIDTLSPWRPGIAYVYSPGALLTFASVSAIAGGATLPSVMLGVGHACLFLFVWLAWDLGTEIGSGALAVRQGDGPSRTGSWPWAMTISAALSVGLWTALLDSHYTAIAGLLFAFGFVTALLRYLRTAARRDAAVAAVMLAAVPIAHPDSAMIVAMGLGAFLLLVWVAADRLTVRRWLVVAVAVPAAAALLAAPWLATIPALLRTGVTSPFAVSTGHWRALVVLHGVVWPALAVFGAATSLRARSAWTLTMVGWLAAVVEFSTLGWLERAWPTVMAPVARVHYPFSIAWHGPIIPYLCLGAAAIVWLAGRTRWRALPAPGFVTALAVGTAVLLGAVSSERLLDASRGRLRLYGAFASPADLSAMQWLRDHSPPGARVLNYPGDYEDRRDWEGHWAPVVTERDCVYFRMQPFFASRDRPGEADSAGALAAAYAEQAALLAFWRDPADPANAARLDDASIDFVLVPESIGDPSSAARSWRWQPPAVLRGARSAPASAPYLRLVYSDGGAQVYLVVGRAVQESTPARDRSNPRHDRRRDDAASGS